MGQHLIQSPPQGPGRGLTGTADHHFFLEQSTTPSPGSPTSTAHSIQLRATNLLERPRRLTTRSTATPQKTGTRRRHHPSSVPRRPHLTVTQQPDPRTHRHRRSRRGHGGRSKPTRPRRPQRKKRPRRCSIPVNDHRPGLLREPQPGRGHHLPLRQQQRRHRRHLLTTPHPACRHRPPTSPRNPRRPSNPPPSTPCSPNNAYRSRKPTGSPPRRPPTNAPPTEAAPASRQPPNQIPPNPAPSSTPASSPGRTSA